MAPRACDVCGSTRAVRPREQLALRRDVAVWVRFMCGTCARRFGVTVEERAAA